MMSWCGSIVMKLFEMCLTQVYCILIAILIKTMFIKETYDRRVKRQEDEGNEGRLLLKQTSTQKIGSIKNNKVNYDREEQFFCKDDIPQIARTIKQEVKDFIDPDFLGLRKKPWNTSVSVPRNIEDEESHERKLSKIKLGMLDYPVTKPSDPVIYVGTETRDDYTGWQVSTEVTKKQLEDNHNVMTETANRHSKSVEKQILTGYVNPLLKTKQLIETQNDLKTTELDLRQNLKNTYKYHNPDASQQKTNAAVFRLAYETGLAVLKNQTLIQTSEPAKPFKANLTQTLREKIKVRHSHTGIWQLFVIKKKTETEEYYAWSCCMNEGYDSPGCVTKNVDGNRWNLTSFNS